MYYALGGGGLMKARRFSLFRCRASDKIYGGRESARPRLFRSFRECVLVRGVHAKALLIMVSARKRAGRGVGLDEIGGGVGWLGLVRIRRIGQLRVYYWGRYER